MYDIELIHAREVLDSRGNPTVEAEVTLTSGAMGRAIVPSGASTGEHEAVELRDGDNTRYVGKGVLTGRGERDRGDRAGARRHGCCDQLELDVKMIELDGTENKGRWARTRFSPSAWRARAPRPMHSKLPLYRYLGGVHGQPAAGAR